MSFKLSLSNLKHQQKLYQVYFSAQILIFSLFFVLQCFSNDQVIVARLAEDTDIKTMIQTISLVFMLFIVFYFLYFNQFFVRQRAEELGIYALLGFKRQEIVRLFLFENLILLILAQIVAVFVGTLFYFLVRLGAVRLLELDVSVLHFRVEPQIFLTMLVVSLFLFLAIYLELELIFKKSLTDILVLQQQQDKLQEKHPVLVFSGIFALLVADGLFLNLTTRPDSLWDKLGYMPLLTLTLGALGLGTILFILETLPYLVDFLLHKKALLYNFKGNVILPRMRHRLRNKGRLLTVLTLLTTASVLLLGLTFLSLSYPYEATKRIVPVTLETMASPKEQLTATQLARFKRDFAVTAVKTPLLKLELQQKWYFSNKHASDHLDLISLSSYDRLMELQQKEKLAKIPPGEGVLINYYAGTTKVTEQFAFKDEALALKVEQATNNNAFAFANSVVTVVLNDHDFQKLWQAHAKKRYYITSLEGENRRDDLNLVAAFKKTKVEYISAAERDQLITRANSPTFLLITMISLLFFVTISTVLYFTARIEEISLLKEYATLDQLGYQLKDLKKIVFSANMWLFLPPLVLGLINGVFGTLGLSYLIADPVTTGFWIRVGQPLAYTLLFFLPVYLSVYVLAGNTITKEITVFCKKQTN